MHVYMSNNFRFVISHITAETVISKQVQVVLVDACMHGYTYMHNDGPLHVHAQILGEELSKVKYCDLAWHCASTFTSDIGHRPTFVTLAASTANLRGACKQGTLTAYSSARMHNERR